MFHLGIVLPLYHRSQCQIPFSTLCHPALFIILIVLKIQSPSFHLKHRSFPFQSFKPLGRPLLQRANAVWPCLELETVRLIKTCNDELRQRPVYFKRDVGAEGEDESVLRSRVEVAYVWGVRSDAGLLWAVVRDRSNGAAWLCCCRWVVLHFETRREDCVSVRDSEIK